MERKLKPGEVRIAKSFLSGSEEFFAPTVIVSALDEENPDYRLDQFYYRPQLVTDRDCLSLKLNLKQAQRALALPTLQAVVNEIRAAGKEGVIINGKSIELTPKQVVDPQNYLKKSDLEVMTALFID